MKLLFVIRNAHGWAGTERVTNLIANALADKYTVEVLSLSEKPSSEAYHASAQNSIKNRWTIRPSKVGIHICQR